MERMCAANPAYEERSLSVFVTVRGIEVEVQGTWYPKALDEYPWDIEAVIDWNHLDKNGSPADLTALFTDGPLETELNRALKESRS